MSRVHELADRAAAAATALSRIPRAVRARALVAAATALEADREGLVGIALSETGLLRERLDGELTRTAVQLRLFADVVASGAYLDVRLDEADPGFALGARPDLRRMLVPLGPVLNFAAGNFPFAFSVAGGDTASALAAGAPVIVKAHPGHPLLSRRTAETVRSALGRAGLPEDTLQLVEGEDEGVELLRHPAIAAAAFTGSGRVGRMLFGIAAARPHPIPFFGELGSVNPVVATPRALRTDPDGFARGLVASVSGSAGQLCTKPGFVFLPFGHGLGEAIAAAARTVPEHRMLSPRIADGFVARREEVLEAAERALVPGTVRSDVDGQTWVTPTFVVVSVPRLRERSDALLPEAFGPLAVIVEYEPDDDLVALCREFFEGELTATIHALPEEAEALGELIETLGSLAGRVLWGGWPTGVAATPAMQHGGPWPSTTSGGTSVGTAAVQRFLRGVVLQSFPAEALPSELRDEAGVPAVRSVAGESLGWGMRATAG